MGASWKAGIANTGQPDMDVDAATDTPETRLAEVKTEPDVDMDAPASSSAAAEQQMSYVPSSSS